MAPSRPSGAAKDSLPVGAHNNHQTNGSEDDAKVSTVTTRTTRSGQKASATVSNVLAPLKSTDKVTKSTTPKATTVQSKTTSSKGTAPRKGKQQASKPTKDPVLGWKADRSTNGDLPPIHDLPDIFTDLAYKSIKDRTTKKMLKCLANRDIRVATMCSGTESPLLALDMIFDAIKHLTGITLRFKHLFSAEIVPFKQAYIERNFCPPIIFRDIRELARDENTSTGSTAYGAAEEIPPDVDILIAGFSCVDFSKLNKWNKTLSETGESGDTFRAILNYASKYRPPIIILENVMGAPWDFIKAVWENDQKVLDEHSKRSKDPWVNVWRVGELAYAAHWLPFDTKDFYLPQTRNRKYMICIDRQKLSSAEYQVRIWGNLMKLFKRPASSPVEAFLLDPDDPRLHRSRVELAETGRGDPTAKREVDWDLCLGRHQDYRLKSHVGSDRPITMWVDGGSCKPPEFWWQGWATAQVERLWDTFEIAFLRNVRRGYDSDYKSRVWELSQNIDRATDTSPWGIITCITPTGTPYMTTRGGPLVGLEVLALQGLPIEKLLLTRETQKELQDLAGNAMSSTVIGAALLSALIAGYKALMDTSSEDRLADAPEQPAVSEMNVEALLPFTPIEFTASESVPINTLRQMANSSVRLCYCEGQTLVSTSRIQQCQECSHTTCQKCGGNPPHVYEVVDTSPSRTLPHEFVRKIRKALPMRLCIMGLDRSRLETFHVKFLGSLSEDDWKIFLDGVDQSFGVELRFQSVKRTHCWIIYYEAPSSRLELAFTKEVVTWSLFAKPGAKENVNSRVRELFKYPLARMTVYGQDILGGQWQLCIPTISNFQMYISGQGDLIQSWESRLGIQSPREADKRVFPSLKISIDPEASVPLDAEICGEYKLLQNCGTAAGSLHKRISSSSDGTERPMYLFLDPERTGDPMADRFVFSADKHRTVYQEVRQLVATLDAGWRPGDIPCSITTGTVYGEWIDCEATLQPYGSSDSAVFAVPAGIDSVGLSPGISTVSPSDYQCSSQLVAFLSCEVPLVEDEIGIWQKGPWCVVDQTSERQTFSSFAWLTERVGSLGGFAKDWKPLDLPDDFGRCVECAPIQPSIEWELKKAGKTMRISPYEDGKQAGQFERAIKARPPPFAIHVRVDADNCGHLMIGLNIPTLAHRALAKLEGLAPNTDVRLYWRLVTEYEWPARFSLPPFKLSSNEQGQKAVHQFVGKVKGTGVALVTANLRDDQKRSLQWMIDQEADNAPPFAEQLIEEATLPQLGWRAEVGVRKLRTIKGGVLADEVGYGKTATTLALIDYQMSKAIASSNIARAGSISIKATLIVVPATLIPQWERQIEKFFGEKYEVVAIKTMVSLNNMSIQRLLDADIVIAPWSLFKGNAYLTKLSRMAALPECPSTNGRAFEAWLSMACQRLAGHTDDLKEANLQEFAHTLKEKTKAAEDDEKLLRAVPTKRLRGKQYVEDAEKTAAAPQQAAPQQAAPTEVDPRINGLVEAGWVVRRANEPFEDSMEADPMDVDVDETDGTLMKADLTEADPMDVDTDETDGALTEADLTEADPMDVDADETDGNLTDDDSTEADPLDDDTDEMDGALTDDDSTEADPMDVDADETDGNLRVDDSTEADPLDDDTDPKKAGEKKKRKKPSYNEDPFGLTSAQSLEQVKCPPLQMFHFARLVVDEYTYVKGNDYSLVASLQASNRWVLSGTPPLDDFADIKTLAGFLGINLGIDDDATGVLKRQNINAIRKDRTTVEQFQAFNQTHSPAWHFKRQKHAQAFLDQFVRQNIPSIEYIAHQAIVRAFPLPAAERAITMELQQQLHAQDMKVCRGGKARKDSGRAQRLRELMQNSKTAEEALLKRCSIFTHPLLSSLKKGRNRLCDAIINERRQQLAQLGDEIANVLRHCTWLDTKIETSATEGDGDIHYRNWKANVASNILGDNGATRQLLDLVSSAEDEYDESHEDQFYREPQTKEEAAIEKKDYLEQLKQQKNKKIEDKRTARDNKKKARNEAKELKDKEPKKAPKKRVSKTVPSIENSNFSKDIIGGICDDSEDSENNSDDNKDNDEGKDEASAEMGLDVDGQVNPTKDPYADLYVPPRDTRPFKFDPEDKAGMVQALRVLTGHLRSLSSELVARIRLLRFFEAVRLVQVWQSGLDNNDVLSPSCKGCDDADVTPSDIFILGVCGHMACRTCLDIVNRPSICVAKETEDCYAAAQSHHIHCAIELGVEDGVKSNYGRKLDSIIALIKNEIPSNDQVLLFVQFDDLMEQISAALETKGVTNHALVERDIRAARDKMNDFQTNGGADRKKVLILNSSNVTAAGANLTNANHVIFVSPPFATTQSAFNASLKQSIGRALRFGQEKTVYIYKFLALKTIDVDITQKRTGEKLVRVTEDEWTLKPYKDVTPEEQEVEWGTGFVHENYLRGEDLEEIEGYGFDGDTDDEDFPE